MISNSFLRDGVLVCCVKLIDTIFWHRPRNTGLS